MSSVLPFVVGIAIAFIGLGVLVPWLVHESRRPVVWPVVATDPPRFPHARLRALMISARGLSLSIARRMEPTPDSVVTHWQSSFAAGRSEALTLADQASRSGLHGARRESARNGRRPDRDAQVNRLRPSTSLVAFRRLEGQETGARFGEAPKRAGREVTGRTEPALITPTEHVKKGTPTNAAVCGTEPTCRSMKKSRWLVGAGALAVFAAVHILQSRRAPCTPGSRAVTQVDDDARWRA
jgi:hypothetical protein